MNLFRSISSLILFLAVTVSSVWGQKQMNPGDNAALRYWSAFAQMQDSAITEQQAKEMAATLDGTVPYDDLQYKDLVEKNRPALDIMARATTLQICNWGLDYQMGSETPVEYARKALVLGRLNVLYAFHLLATGDKDKAVAVLAAGTRFSRDAANGGTLFASLVAKSLLVAHLKAMAFALHRGELSGAQRSALQKAVAQLGSDGLDWRAAMKRELEIDRGLDSSASSAWDKIIPAYLGVLGNPAALPELRQMIGSSPRECSDVIPNPGRVVEAKQNLTDELREIRSSLQ
jgi:hypothetical protein